MKQITIITTNQTQLKYWEEKKTTIEKVNDVMHVVNVHPEVEYQTIRGFGGAFTEASAHIYQQMSEEKKKAIIEDCFGESGLRYNMGRIHMNSCDFALGNYTYVEEGDTKLNTFDISHDFKEIIPMIQEAQVSVKSNIDFLVSPWSPPAFMKTNEDMNHGGSLKAEYYCVWAKYFVKFIKEYEKAGIKIQYLTVQNEPQAVQMWDSCIYTSEEESVFVRDYLGPELENTGLSKVGIYVWDHNKEELYQRFKEVVADPNTEKYVAGVAAHWYTGDHFEGIEMVCKEYPGKEVFFTEGCVEYSRFADSGEVQKAEMYAHDILGNLNAGISASLDWNLLLDNLGGPNHVGNFCAAPLMCNLEENTYERRLTYYYIGQFSRYIKAGAKKIGTTRYTDKIEVSGFCNPDGERVVVVLNKTDTDVEITLREGGQGTQTSIKAHEIKTFCYK